MSEETKEPGETPTVGVPDEQLPEDVRPGEDNPLAVPLTEEDDPKSPEELDMAGGKVPEQSEQPASEEREEGDSGA